MVVTVIWDPRPSLPATRDPRHSPIRLSRQKTISSLLSRPIKEFSTGKKRNLDRPKSSRPTSQNKSRKININSQRVEKNDAKLVPFEVT